MACVLRNEQFKRAAKQNNISEDQLELIVHEFINTVGNETSFPSSDYIEQKVSGKSIEVGKNGFALWERQFSTPKVFKTQKEVDDYLNTVSLYFSREATGIKVLNNGDIQVTIAKPTINESFNEDNLSPVGLDMEYTQEMKDILAKASRDNQGRLLANPNQIKSATDNVGTYSEDIGNIYFNLNENLKNTLDKAITQERVSDFIKQLKIHIEYINASSDFKTKDLFVTTVHKYNGSLFIHKKYNSEWEPDMQYKMFNSLIENYGLKDVLTLVKHPNSLEVKINEANLRDAIDESSRVSNLYSNTEEANRVLDILNFLKGRLGINYKVINEWQALAYHPYYTMRANAFYENGTAYFISGKKLTADIAAEEMLHPLVAAIKKNNPEEFQELLAEARKYFPQLHLQITERYSEGRVDEELVTQALSRAFKEERKNNPEGNKYESLIKRFTKWVLSLFSKSPQLKFGEKLTLQSLAALINSESELLYEKVDNLIKYNLTDENTEDTVQAKNSDKQIVYTPIGKTQQTYTIKKSEDGQYQIINKEGKEVFKTDSKDRRRIFANLAVQEGRAVVVEYKDNRYVVNNKDTIISVSTGDLMQWGEENEGRKAIIELAKTKFASLKSNNLNQSIQQQSESNIAEVQQREEVEAKEVETVVVRTLFNNSDLQNKGKVQIIEETIEDIEESNTTPDKEELVQNQDKSEETKQQIRTPLKEKYRGKLIFAQSGTGKTTIADNIDVIDSDYILAQILGVDTPLAYSAFNTLSWEEKKQISQEYDWTIKKYLSQGKTVITARIASIKDADVIIYNESAKLSAQRVSNIDRANTYQNDEYQQRSLEQIKSAVAENKETKEVIVLNESIYLSDVILTDPKFNIQVERLKQFDTTKQLLAMYLQEFGFSIKDLVDNGYSIDLLERTISISSEQDITTATGELIAFMSMFNPVEKKLIAELAVEEGLIKREEIFNDKGDIIDVAYRYLDKTKYYKMIGQAIAEELQHQFNYAKENNKFDTSVDSVKDFKFSRFIERVREIIKQFFDKFKEYPIAKKMAEYSRIQAINALSMNTSFIRNSVLKPGDEEAGIVSRVHLKEALDQNPYELDIIKKLSENGIALAGSASMALQGRVLRPKTNPLHDLDFDTDGMDKEQLDALLPNLFENIQHFRTILHRETGIPECESYITMSVPFIIEPIPNSPIEQIKDANTNEVIATRNGNSLTILKESIQGKILDFFVNNESEQYKPLEYKYKDTTLLIGNWKRAMDAKLFKYGSRFKDIWDFNRFIPEQIEQNNTEMQEFIKASTTIMGQIETLYSSELLSKVEIREIAESVANLMSDYIDEIIENPELIGKTKDQVLSMSRKDILQALGANKFITDIKTKFSKLNIQWTLIPKRNLIMENWDAIIQLAMASFKQAEGFNFKNIAKPNKINDTKTTTDANDDLSKQDKAETGVSQQMSWQIDSRTQDAAKISQLVKREIKKCYILDENGDYVIDAWGVKKRVDVKSAISLIYKWTSKDITYTEMVNTLKANVTKYPWIQQLLTKLEDTSGNFTQLQAQFYHSLKKSFQLYSSVFRKNGKMISQLSNKDTALKDAMKSIQAQFNLKQYPLFNKNGTLNIGTRNTIANIYNGLIEIKEVNKDNLQYISEQLSSIAIYLGLPCTPQNVSEVLDTKVFKSMLSNLHNILTKVDGQRNNPNYAPFDFNSKDSINSYLKNFISPITSTMENVLRNQVYNDGKMYQSVVIPSYLTKLMAKFTRSRQQFEKFIESEYGPTEFFYDEKRKQYRNTWIQLMIDNENTRQLFEHKVQLNYNKKNYMKDLNSSEYTLSLIAEYFAETTAKNSSNSQVPAWFKVPMLSNKPSSEFIKFVSFRGTDYQDPLLDGFQEIFIQELYRIKTCMNREEIGITKNDPRYIKHFDKNGLKFCFLSFLNAELESGQSSMGKLIRQFLKEGKLAPVDWEKLFKEFKATTKEHINSRIDTILKEWEKKGIVEACKKIENIGVTEDLIKSNLRNFIWNDTFATMQILQLTITDVAFYKDAEDLQKRLAEIHAPGLRLMEEATDENGQRVSDGKLRTIYLDDVVVKSEIISNVKVALQSKLEEMPEHQKKDFQILADGIINQFEKVNWADAQAYTSLTGLRKKAYMMGKWSHNMELKYEKIRSGNYDYKDLLTFSQVIKPFVYTQIFKDSDCKDSPISKLKVGIQNKNSEYLLFLADALIQGSSATNDKPNILRVLSGIMEESHYDKDGNYKANGIDTIQFNSAVKAGEQGVLNISQYLTKDGITEEDIKEELRKQICRENGSYDLHVVDEIPVEDYAVQQEVPEHFINHYQAHGSQDRFMIISDLIGNSYNVNGREYKSQELKDRYESLISENIQMSIEELAKELNLDSLDIKERNNALSKILVEEILNSDRYDIELAIACSVNQETGQFNIPLSDPIQSKRIEQLIHSIIKNRINKQEIAGGPVVQVSNFGTSDHLHIRFKDKDGNILPTQEEYESREQEQSYEDFLKENQYSIAYYEVYVSIYDEALLEFMDDEGRIDIRAIEVVNPKMLEMIGYRIPTEDKYSAAPLKIVGFLPREAGEAIMLPAEITTITGSDFDVDKFYIMRHVSKYIKRNLGKDTKARLEKIQNGMISYLIKKSDRGDGSTVPFALRQTITNNVRQFIKEVKSGKSPFSPTFNSGLIEAYTKVVYKDIKIRDRRAKNNNEIIDIHWSVLTSYDQMPLILNPGGFDEQKQMGYIIQALKSQGKPVNEDIYKEMLKQDIDTLKKIGYRSKNLAFIDEQIKFYEQNSAAASLIGIFAVHKTAHAVLEGNKYFIKTYDEKSKDNTELFKKRFSDLEIGSLKLSQFMEIDPTYDTQGNMIDKTLGSYVAAAADAVKDPVLNLMNININTANILTTLTRLGMPFKEATLFVSQKPICEVIEQFENSKLNEQTSIGKVIDKMLQTREVTKDSTLYDENLTMEEMLQNINTPSDESYAKALIMFKRVSVLSHHLSGPTLVTRFNSMAGGTPGPLIIDDLIMEYKLSNFSSQIVDGNSNPVQFTDILERHPILKNMYQSFIISNQVLQGFIQNNQQFRSTLSSFTEYPYNNIMRSRNLLSKFVDFYMSYLMIAGTDANGNLAKVIDEKEFKYYTDTTASPNFVSDYLKSNLSVRYKNNPFIQAIKLTINKKDNTPQLSIDTVGLENTEISKLSSGWADLYKENEKLALGLFKYWFFKGGIGFNPKTSMNLLPIELKMKISNYISTLENPPIVASHLIIDQFIRHNSSDYRLVKQISNENATIEEIIDKDDFALDTDKTWYKITLDEDGWGEKHNYLLLKTNQNSILLKKYSQSIDNTLIFEEISTLGQDGNFLELSVESIEDISDNNTAIQSTSTVEENEEQEVIDPIEAADTEIVSNYLVEESIQERANTKKQMDEAMAEQFKKDVLNRFKKKLSEILGKEASEAKIERLMNKMEETLNKIC